MIAVVKIVAGVVVLLVVLTTLAITIVPRFLDRIYYRGPASDHFDGQRFFNPDGDADTLRPPTGNSRAGFLWRYLTKRDGRPAWPDHVAVDPIPPPARVEGDRMVVTWIGHATVLIQTQGLNILTDPVWSDRAGPFGLIGPTRVTVPGIGFDALPRIDVVLLSHNHYDHLDLATIERLWRRDRPRIITSLGNDSVIAQTGAAATAIDWGTSVVVKPGIAVVATRAHHWTSRWFTDRNRALWSGFVVNAAQRRQSVFRGRYRVRRWRLGDRGRAPRADPAGVAADRCVPLRSRTNGDRGAYGTDRCRGGLSPDRRGARDPHPLGHVPAVVRSV